MSFLHSHTEPCLKTELDLFSLPPTQSALESTRCVFYKPVSSLSYESPIEFCNGQNEDYLDLVHTLIKVKVRLTPYNKEKDGLVAPVNNFLHSMFNQVDVYFNQKLVSPANNAYPYRAYIESLLNYGPAVKASHLMTNLWVNDVAGEMDEMTSSGKNEGLIKRHKYLQDGKTVDLIGNLHCDVFNFNQDKLLLNDVEVRLRLVRSKDAFCLMDKSDINYTVHITEATLLVRRVKVRPTVLIAHANTLASTTAKYPKTRIEIKSFTIHSGITGENLENVILGSTRSTFKIFQ